MWFIILAFYILQIWAECPFSKNTKQRRLLDKDLDLSNWDCDIPKPVHYEVDPDPGQGTVMGCECDSNCGATIDFGSANCDWCYTKNKCGSYAYSRLAYYDYCVYPVKQDYESQTWLEKEQYLWGQVTANTARGSYPNAAGIVAISIQPSFDNQWDVMNAGRQKYIHGVGSVCLINMDVTSNSYTGIFKQGTARGMIRMGSALDFGGWIPGIDNWPMTPGNGFKFLRSGVQSANWVTLYNLDGQDSYNFFENNQTNHIPPPSSVTTITVGEKFKQASDCITMVGLSDAASYDQEGNPVSSPKFPYKLTFSPTPDSQGYIPASKITKDEFLLGMSGIPSGTKLYTIWATSYPGANPQYFGDITTTTQCTSSKFGDESLYIRHQRIEEDFQLEPSWISMMNVQNECGVSSVDDIPPPDCTEE